MSANGSHIVLTGMVQELMNMLPLVVFCVHVSDILHSCGGVYVCHAALDACL